MMARLTKVHNSGGKFPTTFDVFYRVFDGDYSFPFKSYIAFLGRSNVSILIDDLKEAPTDVIDSIRTYVMVLIIIFNLFSITFYNF